MIITQDYCRLMARYNQWQNQGLREVTAAMPLAELQADRGAFWGSILGTLNHLLWGDLTWMSRFDGGPGPGVGMKGGPELCPTAAAWGAERDRCDGRISLWAERLSAADLAGDLRWVSGAIGAEVTRPLAPLVVHLFNHQTHHRGQVHALLTAAGHKLPDTDLFVMPQ